MVKPHSRIKQQLAALGKLNASWNELEGHIRIILMKLSPDFLTAGLFVADMQISSLITTARMVALEHQDMLHRMNTELEAANRKGKKVKLFDDVYGHVNHLLTCTDILREHRNYYVHNTVLPKSRRVPFLLVGKITAPIDSRSRRRYSTNAR